MRHWASVSELDHCETCYLSQVNDLTPNSWYENDDQYESILREKNKLCVQPLPLFVLPFLGVVLR